MGSGYSGYSGNAYSGYSGPGNCFDITYNSVAAANANIGRIYRHAYNRIAILNEAGKIEIYKYLNGADDKDLVKVDFKNELELIIPLMNKFIEENDTDLYVAQKIGLCISGLSEFYRWRKNSKLK